MDSRLRGNDELARGNDEWVMDSRMRENGMTCRGTGVILHVEVAHVE